MTATNLPKNIAPYVIKISNTNFDDGKALLFGGVKPVIQDKGVYITVWYGDYSPVTYENILQEMFLQTTKIGLTIIEIIDGFKYDDEAIEVKTWQGDGCVATWYLKFGHEITRQSDKLWKIEKEYPINVLTQLKIPIKGMTDIKIYFYPSEIEKLQHGKEIYDIVSSREFQALLKQNK